MDIAKAASGLQQAKLQMDVSFAVAAKVKDVALQNGEVLRQMLEKSITPHLGGNIDMKL